MRIGLRLSSPSSVNVAAAVLSASLVGCGAGTKDPELTVQRPFRALHVVAEGPCAKLSAQAIGKRRFVVFGDTGYELAYWNPGDLLPAAQSFVEIRDGKAFRNLGMLDGLPKNVGGYIPGDLLLGGSSLDNGWLLRATTHYAPTGTGVLFRRSWHGYAWQSGGWAASQSAQVVRYPLAAKGLPALPVETMCEPYDEGLRFVPSATATLPSGHVMIGGTCQAKKHIRLRNAVALIAHGRPSTNSWRVERLPETDGHDGIVNLAIHLAGPREAYAAVYEPFKSIPKRIPYLAHYDGKTWSITSTPIKTGMTSVAGSSDGTLWVAAGHELWKRSPTKGWHTVKLPRLLFAKPARPPTLRVTAVRVFAGNDIWAEGAFRLKLEESDGEPATEARASVLWRSTPAAHVLYCDPRKRAPKGLTAVDVGDER